MLSTETMWPRDALPEGFELHGYRLQGVIGRGGFGITYRAIDAIDQVFAIKECFPRQFAVRQGRDVLPADHNVEEPLADCISRFTREARILAHLTAATDPASDGVVRVVTFFQTNGTGYIVMEYLGDDSLAAVIADNPGGIPEARLKGIFAHLLKALTTVHDAGLLHRDIKPLNILFRDSDHPVLIDFGAAREVSSGQTSAFTRVFSEGYSPIEQRVGLKQGPYSDIYALGATCYKAVGGTIVDSYTRQPALLRGHSDPLPPATKIGAGRYSVALLEAIDTSLRVEPEQRPQSAHEVLAMILRDGDADAPRKRPKDTASTEHSKAAAGLRLEPWPALRWDRRKLGIAGGAAVALGIAVALVPLYEPSRLPLREAPRNAGASVPASPASSPALSPPAAAASDAVPPAAGIPTTSPQATAPPSDAPAAANKEALFWSTIKDSENVDEFAEYLKQYPTGSFADLARKRINELNQSQQQAMVTITPPLSGPVVENLNATFVAVRTAKVRSEPKATAQEFGILSADTAVDVTGRIGKEWLRIAWKGAQAYVSAPLLQEVDAAEVASWGEVKGAKKADEVVSFLESYPKGFYADKATELLASLYARSAAAQRSFGLRIGALLFPDMPPRSDNEDVRSGNEAIARMDYVEALRRYRRAADAGDAGAIYAVGFMYDQGFGVKQDRTEAARWYRRAADAGVAFAMYNLGLFYERGDGVKQDYAEALRWYRRSGDAGVAGGWTRIGDMYSHKDESVNVVTLDYAEALRWYRRAADAGDEFAMFDVGYIYEHGNGVKQDYTEALRWYRRAAAAGDLNGMNGIGRMYDDGYGVKQDYTEALRWYHRANDAGDPEAAFNIGAMYENGHGVKQDDAEALRWYRKAADSTGDPTPLAKVRELEKRVTRDREMQK